MSDYLTMDEMKRLFHQDHRDIKLRAMKGDFEFMVEHNRWYFTRTSVLKHLDELRKKNNRGPNQQNLARKRPSRSTARGPWASRKNRSNQGRRL